MKRLKILMAASEAGPYVRTGGLGDVMGALPAALAQLGHEVKVILPRYACLDLVEHQLKPFLDSLEVPDQGDMVEVTVERAGNGDHGVEFFLIGNNDYFGRTELYVDPATGRDFADNDLRFAFFSRAVLEMARESSFRPDIIHVHDWQAALVPVYLKAHYQNDPTLRDCGTVLTIHNLGYQGLFKSERFAGLDLPPDMFKADSGPLEFYERVNFLKGGILTADKITTVSEQYAREIQATEEFGCGLEGVLADRTDDLIGILNGVDYHIWSPKTDRLLFHRYSLSNLSGKKASRVELLVRAGLPVREKTPLVGMVTRLVSQKGIDLVLDAADQFFALNLQMIILGTGDTHYHERLRALASAYPDQLKTYFEFNDELAHQIQAGADIFLMPSRYEPCGLNQMYALKYGTVPVVRAVGGLADTVTDYDADPENGTGFVFEAYEATAMIEALSRAVDLFGRRRVWKKLVKTGMRKDFSWAASADKYAALYQSVNRSQVSVG